MILQVTFDRSGTRQSSVSAGFELQVKGRKMVRQRPKASMDSPTLGQTAML